MEKYTHLTAQERAMIAIKLEEGCSLQVIARRLQRNVSNVLRERKRHRASVCDTYHRRLRRKGLSGEAKGFLQKIKVTNENAALCVLVS